MKAIRGFFIVAVMITALPVFAADKAEDSGKQAVRQRFVPRLHNAAGGNGANWSALNPFPDKGGLPTLMARADIGDMFPVQEAGKAKFFDMVVIAGNDNYLMVECRSEAGAQRFNLRRDKQVSARIGEHKYSLLYPSIYVNADDKPTTNKAMIIVQWLPGT